MRATYEIANRKRYWPSLSVSIAELDGVQGFSRQPQCYLLHAAPQTSASVLVEMLPSRRGIHHFDRYQLATGFPFGFVKRAIIDRRKEHVLIYPALGQMDDRLLERCRSAELTGSTVRPRPGGMDEFFGVKQFRDGENRRSIYWRRSARTGVLVAREMTRVAPPRLMLLLDTFVETGTVEERGLIERAIAMAATLASSTLEQGLSVGVFGWQGGWASIAPARGKQQRADVLSFLARLPANREAQLESLLEECHSTLKTGVTPVLATPRNIQMGMLDEQRAGMVVISSNRAAPRQYFQFPASIDFENCSPLDAKTKG